MSFSAVRLPQAAETDDTMKAMIMTTWQRTTTSGAAVAASVLFALGGAGPGGDPPASALAERTGSSSVFSARCGEPGTTGLPVELTVRRGTAGSMLAV